MHVENKKMYHYHKLNAYDDLWKVNNELVVDNNFKSNYFSCIFDASTGVVTNDKKITSFNKILDDYLEQSNLLEDYLKLKSYNDNELREEMYKMHTLLEMSFKIITNSGQQNRELALEEYRKNNCSNLPSRAHSIWVIDEEQINYWKTKLSKGSILFELNLTGELFKSSDDFLPNDGFSIREAYKVSNRYWFPDLEHINNENVEYLFQGRAKILKKIKC